MKDSILGVALATLLVLSVGEVAAGEGGHGKDDGGKKYVGCLRAGDAPGVFKLTNVDGSKEYELVGGGSDLKAHVGHKVEVDGKEAPAEAAAAAEKPAKATEKSGHETKEPGATMQHAHGDGAHHGHEAGHEHLKVSSMRHIAATCP